MSFFSEEEGIPRSAPVAKRHSTCLIMSNKTQLKDDTSQTDADIVRVSGTDGFVTISPDVLAKIPYFQPLLSGRWEKGDGGLSCSLKRNVLYACLAYAESNLKNPAVLLTKLESTSGSVPELIRAMEFLCLSVPKVSTLDELCQLEKALKDTKAEEMTKIARRTYERSYEIPDRCGARNAAAKLCFSLVQQSLDATNSNKIRSKIVNDVLYVVSHARTFGPRLRKHLWRTFEMIFTLTVKQQKQFDQWVAGDALDFDLHKDSDDKDERGSCTDGEGTTGSIHQDDECYGSDEDYYDGCYMSD
ncbi:hypothetical protein ACA910_020127 [Epithemia clementina (nom. ined.)]